MVLFLLVLNSITLHLVGIFADLWALAALAAFERPAVLSARDDEATAIRGYLGGAEGDEWLRLKVSSLDSHRVFDFELRHRGLRVVGGRKRIAYHRDGYVDWVSGFTGESSGRFDGFASEEDADPIRERFEGRFPGTRVSVEPVYFLEEGVFSANYDVWVARAGWHRHFIVDLLGRVIRDLKTFWSDPGVYHPAFFWGAVDVGDALSTWGISDFWTRAVKGYEVSPLVSSATAVTLTGLTGSTGLASGQFVVQRDQNTSAVTAVHVDPNTDFTAVTGFSESPAVYSHTCTGNATSCANQGFDAVNVYFHLTKFRTRLDRYFSEMGLSGGFSTDPLAVVINAMRLDFDNDGVATDEANNAAYYPLSCGTDANGVAMKRCLIFLRPGAVNSPSCGGAVQLYDLAREAVVVVHEYQHYVTDLIAELEPGTSATPSVGDALHEGYSDYFAASHVSQESNPNGSGSDVTRIGAYAFQKCSGVIRDLSQVRVYQNITNPSDPNTDIDPHNSGLSWASGLWDLRKKIGATSTDKIALRSEFFLSTRPSFFEAVEALVQADKSLNSGVNASLIREIFYKNVRFLGGTTDAFRDPVAGVVETGLRGCAVAGGDDVQQNTPMAATASSALFLIWLVMTLGVSCRFSR